MQQAAAIKPPVDYVKEQNLKRWADSLEKYDKDKLKHGVVQSGSPSAIKEKMHSHKQKSMHGPQQ